MIAVLVPYFGTPRVFSASPDDVVAMISDSRNHIATLPPGVMASEFETAWIRLTLDLKDARRFDTVAEALDYYRSTRENLNALQHANILHALNNLVSSSPDHRHCFR